jgi:hypothetical protein
MTQIMKNQIFKQVLNGAILLAVLAAFTQTASALPKPVGTPDAASTAGLMTVVCAGLVVVRRFRR